MSRRGRRTGRQRSEQELLNAFETSLSTLEHLAQVYDGGHAPIALAMSTEVRKLLTENAAAVRLRVQKTFETPAFGDERNMLNAMHKLTTARVYGDPLVLEFVPDFYMAKAGETKQLTFREWWNRDVIYRAGAAAPGTDPGLIPLTNAHAIPFDKREKITRREFVDLLRNKLGAHEASQMPTLLDELDDSRSWGRFEVQTERQLLSTSDGTLVVKVGIMAAMMRQIAHEVLVAYGRKDVAPSAVPNQTDTSRT